MSATVGTRIALVMVVLPVTVAFQAGTARADDNTVGGERLASHGYVWDRSGAEPPHIQASSYVIADLETGGVLAAKDPHGQFRPASTLKTLTSITLIPRLNPLQKVRPSPRAVDISGSAVGLSTKWTYTVRDLFYGMLMQSGNDAAIALCEANGGLNPTIDQLNAEARRIRALDTVARTPNGLDDDPPFTLAQQHSSAYDLALIMKQGLKLPDFRKYVGRRFYNWPAPPNKEDRKKHRKNGDYEIGTHDHLLVGNPYRGMIGGKNGWTSHALGSFVGAATRDGHTIIIALMHAQSDFWGDARTLLDWGFRHRATVRPVGTLADPVPPPPVKKQAKAAAAPGHPVDVAPGDRTAWWQLGVPGAVVLAAFAGGLALLRRRRRAADVPAAPTIGGGHVRPILPATLRPQRRRRPKTPPGGWTVRIVRPEERPPEEP